MHSLVQNGDCHWTDSLSEKKYRKNEHQKLPSKKPFVAIINEFLRCYVRNEAKTLLYLHSAVFIDVVLCRLNQLKIRNSGVTFTWETNVRKEIEKKVKESVKINVWKEKNEKSEKREWEKKGKKQSERKKWEAKRWAKVEKKWEREKKWENNCEKMMDE